ncbi:MAG: DNA polymerase III subunit delta' [Wenzhouxiangellaceae bacterium]|nr:DNA polymerase III subunit delta' [Wenzhouxiangellaceae bacterium]
MSLPWLDGPRAALDSGIEGGRLGHAPLLRGPAGVGKRELAEWLLRRLLCHASSTEAPCGRCASCHQVEAGIHPDLFRLGVLEDKKEIVVDQVRGFIDSLILTPALGPRRVGVIVPADAMNRNAANALLKTLEEPSDEVWLVLVADREDRLPATIRSRCQQLTLRPPSTAVARDWLHARHPGREVAELEQALFLAGGAPLEADQWLGGEGLAAGLAMAEHLAGLLQQPQRPARVPESWVAEPAFTWSWLARLVRLWLGQLHDEGEQPIGTLPLPDRPDAVERLEACWRAALNGRRLAGESVRHDWLLQRWLQQWCQLAESG